MYNSERILYRLNQNYENKNNDDGNEYVYEINGREYEIIYLMNKCDYDDNFS